MKRKTIIVFLASLCLVFSLLGCSGNNATNPVVSDVESSIDRLDELRKEKEKSIAQENAERDAEKAQQQAEEERRQEIRDSITKNGELLDEIVGEWGFVAPRWAGSTSVLDPKIRFYIFAESGDVSAHSTYAEYGRIRPLISRGQYAIDEENSTIIIIFDELSSETELRYEFKDGHLDMYGGFYGANKYSDDNKTELFKANWSDLWSGIGQKDTSFIQEIADENPELVPDFFKQSKNTTDDTELSNALVGQWGTITPTWMEDRGHGTYKCRPALFCYDFSADGKVTLTCTTPAEDGTQTLHGVYCWDEENNTITLSFDADTVDFSYSFENGRFKLYGGFFNGKSFTQDGLIELFKKDWTEECTEIATMSRKKLDEHLRDYLNEHPEYKSDFFSNN